MSKREKKPLGKPDLIYILGDTAMSSVNYDHAIEAMKSILCNPPSHEGRARQTKEDWGKTRDLSKGEWDQALEAWAGALENVQGALGETREHATELPDIADVEADLSEAAPPVPPTVGETLIGLFCSRDMREAVLGDLDEKFAEIAERRGAKFAKAWYWGQAGRSVLFFAFRWGRRVLELEAILKRIL